MSIIKLWEVNVEDQKSVEDLATIQATENCGLGKDVYNGGNDIVEGRLCRFMMIANKM
jgi:hypothetical protein